MNYTNGLCGQASRLTARMPPDTVPSIQQLRIRQLKKILFLCSGNTCRSPLAEGIARKILADRVNFPVEISSAGTSAFEGMPASQHSVEVAARHGIDLDGHRSTLLNRTRVREADLIVTMGCEVEGLCPVNLAPDRTVDWGLEDPMGKGVVKYREIRDLIDANVLELFPGGE